MSATTEDRTLALLCADLDEEAFKAPDRVRDVLSALLPPQQSLEEREEAVEGLEAWAEDLVRAAHECLAVSEGQHKALSAAEGRFFHLRGQPDAARITAGATGWQVQTMRGVTHSPVLRFALVDSGAFTSRQAAHEAEQYVLGRIEREGA